MTGRMLTVRTTTRAKGMGPGIGEDGEDNGGIITAAAPPTIAVGNCSWGGTGSNRDGSMTMGG
jgi:hypothetical protein